MRVILFLVIAAFIFGCSSKRNQEYLTKHDIHWVYQVDSLLMPYWMSNEAYGNPQGNFPNYRLSDGTIVNYNNFDFSLIPQPLTEFLITQPDSLRRNYIRINSRQIYTYCVAYHITGNEDYLIRAKTGLDYLFENGGYDSGSPYTYWQNGNGMPDKLQSTTQDLAYSLTGPTMYYYLTRDQEVLDKILKVKNFVLTEYYENSEVKEKTKLVAWVKKDFENDSKSSKKLLAVLDQLNAYLLLLTPILPDKTAKPIFNDIKNLAYSLKDNFYSAKHNLFWGDLDNKRVDESPTDFGHSIKSFWMLYTASKIISDKELEAFAYENALKLLETAYINDEETWAEMYIDSTYQLSKNKVWWNYAELDQVAATFSLRDTTLYSKYLKKTYKYWEQNMIDHENKEVHFLLDPDGNPIDLGLKTCHWKNGFHSMEHALIGFLSTCNYNGQNIDLYYAFEKNKFPEAKKIKPYYYNGKITNTFHTTFESQNLNQLSKVKVTFEKIE